MAEASTSKWHSDVFGLVIGALVSSIIALLYLLGAFQVYEWKTRDLRQIHFAPKRVESPDILILDIDEQSIQALRSQVSWPWPRQIHSLIVGYLRAAGARAVVFDVMFIDEAPSMIDPDSLDKLVGDIRQVQSAMENSALALPDAAAKLKTKVAALAGLNQHNDEVFAKAIQAAGNVLLGMVFDSAGRGVSDAHAKRFGLAADPSLDIPDKLGSVAVGPMLPVPKLLATVKGVGHTNYLPDRDGIIRSVQLFLSHGGRLYPSLAARTAMHLVAPDASGVRVVRGRSFRLNQRRREIVVPMDETGRVLVNYTHTFRRVPYYKVLASAIQLRDGQAPLLAPKEFAGKTVLVGASAKGLLDLRPTAVSAQHMGVEVQAQTVANLLDGTCLRETDRGVTVAIIFVSAIVLGVILQRLGPAVSTLLLGALVVAYCAGAVYVFRATWLWLDIVAPCAAMLICHIAVIGHKFSSVERQHFLEKELLQHELEIAKEVQTSLMPEGDPESPNTDISGWNLPCDATGGDYYDFVELDDGRLAIVLGDVTGHGLGPALIMAATRSYLRSIIQGTQDPSEILIAMNELLCSDLQDGRFVTMFLCVLDPRTGEVTYSSAGHESPLVLHGGSDDIDELDSTGVPLGCFDGESYENGPGVRLGRGDMLVILTDGVFEAMNRDKELFGHERLCNTLRDSMAHPAAEVIKTLHRAVEEFRGKAQQQDDITMIVVKMTGSGGEATEEGSDEVTFEDADDDE